MLKMKKIFLALSAFALSLATLSAQDKPTMEEYNSRYEKLVARVGADGLGVETLLDHWIEDYPEDETPLVGKFSYYFTKSRSVSVEVMDVKKYLGENPTLTLKDSTGKDVNYFQVATYDDEIFGKATQNLDKAISRKPARLDLRFLKVAAYTQYEKESPDMAVNDLNALIDYNFTQRPSWEYPGMEMNDEVFLALIQEYCYTFFTMGTPRSFKAFKELSEKVLSYSPKNTLFMDNLGSYALVVDKDSKAALKMYNKVLKIDPRDYTAIKNCVLIARRDKNAKLEKKYLPMLVEVSEDEAEKASAEARLNAL